MRVVQINATYGIPGIGLSAKQVSDYLTAKGIDNISFYGDRRNSRERAIFMGGFLSHKVHALYSRIVGRTGYLSILATLKTIRQIRRYQPDIVHLRNLHANFVNIPILLHFLAKNDIATVISLHDCFMMTGGCTHYTTNQCFKWQSQCKDCHFLTYKSDYYFVRSVKRAFNDKRKWLNRIPRLGVIGVSDWITDEAKKSPLFKNALLIERIYNWIDFNVFKPYGPESCLAVKNKLGIGDKKMILAVSSFWTESKGFNELLELANRIVNDAIIVMVGKQVVDNILPGNVIAVPRTYNQDELAAFYSAADVFIHLSWEETFGKVIAEAIACGTPVITYDSTACPELVADGCGIVVKEKGNVSMIESALKDLLSKDKSFYREPCIKKSVALFDMQKNCAAHIDFYKRLLEK